MTFHRSKSIREAIQLIWNVENPSGQNQSKTRLRSVGLEASAMVLLMVLIGFGGGRGMSRGTVACSRTGLHTTCTWFWGIWTLLLNTLIMDPEIEKSRERELFKPDFEGSVAAWPQKIIFSKSTENSPQKLYFWFPNSSWWQQNARASDLSLKPWFSYQPFSLFSKKAGNLRISPKWGGSNQLRTRPENNHFS